MPTPQPDPVLQMDFFGDLSKLALQQLTSAGYQVDPSETAEKIFIKYFNVANRRVATRVRTVVMSKEFRCPAPLQAGFQSFRQKVESGQNIRPHQSTRLADEDFDDALLNDWGIQHLHLGASLRPNGWIERTGDVLFARVTDSHIYCIDVLDHTSFSKQALIEIVHRNWPETVEHFKLKGIQPLMRFTDSDIHDLRNAGITVTQSVSDGSVYAPIGGGYMTSGISMNVIRACDHVRRICLNMEGIVTRAFAAFLADARLKGDPLESCYRFELRITSQKTEAVETSNPELSIGFGPALAFAPLQ